MAGSWTLTFADEFDGSSVDLAKWRPNWAFWLANADAQISKPVNDQYELSCYDPSMVTVGHGVLTLSAAQQSCTANNGVTYAYRSGLIESYNHYQFTYGYMEARMWLPANGTGVPVWRTVTLDPDCATTDRVGNCPPSTHCRQNHPSSCPEARSK